MDLIGVSSTEKDNDNLRFSTDTPEDILKHLQSESTKRKTTYDITLLRKFLLKKLEIATPIELIPPNELCRHLSKFIASVRKQNGENFEPVTVRGLAFSINR